MIGDLQKEFPLLSIELDSAELELVIAMLNDRRARNQKLGGKTASRVTRYACVHECGLIEGILGKIDAANGAT
jgi:hypothetical protein